jgi:hypothetical protein
MAVLSRRLVVLTLVGCLWHSTLQRVLGEDKVGSLAARIDRALEAQWKAQGLVPVGPASDAEFFRRVNLDLAGCVPSAADVRTFLADRAPDKRRRWTDRLLDGPRHVRHQTNQWRDLLLPAANGPQVPRWRVELEAWLREQFQREVPYDRMVRELLTAPFTAEAVSPGGGVPADPTALSFYRAADYKAENLGSNTARVFLGVNLECAQCHDHPFAPLTKRDFAGFAAFYAGVRPTRWQAGRVVAVAEDADRHSFALAGGEAIPARFLDGTEPRWGGGASGRTVLAAWLTSPDNPYFARHAVDRIWEQVFGVPLAADEGSPFKDLRDDLARTFAAEGFDTKLLLRAAVASRAYQLTSASGSAESSQQTRLFARMRVRGLSADQLFDSIVRASRLPESNDTAFRADFLERFNQPGEKTAERQTSILQALTLMNGPLLATATHPEQGPLLATVAAAPWLDAAGQVDALYLATLSRTPSPAERARFVAHVDGAAAADRRQALADVLWALLNSSEFLFNH